MADPEKPAAADGVEQMATNEEESKAVTANPFGNAAVLGGLMQNPQVLAALQNQLGTMVGVQSGYIESLPKVVKRRIKGLKKLQFEVIKIESKFYEEVHELECKYAEQFAPLFDRRREIVTGGVEPTDSDCDWPSDEEEELAADLTKKAVLNDEEKKEETAKEAGDKDKEEEEEEKPPGVPSFWLTIFKSTDMLSEMVQDHDEPILEHLTDIKVKFSKADPMGFTLEFFFSANEYFTNTVLTKEYILRSEPDTTEPFTFEGPEIVKCVGCKIDWVKGKNVTQKLVKKVQKHQSRGTRRTITKTVQTDSFFNFFNPPEVADGEEPDEDTENILAADFEIGHFIRERVVPRAVLYFTGEALEDEYDDDEEGEEGDDEGEDDAENDPDFEP